MTEAADRIDRHSASLAELASLAEGMIRPGAATPDWVTEVLREAILGGVIRPGAPLRQDLIAAALGVSKIPIREALRLLAAEGLVRFERNRGALVTDLSIEEAREIFKLRAALERLALEQAFAQLGEEDFAKAEAILFEEEGNRDIARVGDINRRFHDTLYGPGMGSHLRTLLTNLLRISERYVRLHLSEDTARGKALAEHRALLAACRAGDRTRALRLLDAHLAKAVSRLSRRFEGSGLAQSKTKRP